MIKPQVIGDASGRWLPNPAFYGFSWPGVQVLLDRGQALWDKSAETTREWQALIEEKHQLVEADLVKAEAVIALASVGLSNTQIGRLSNG